MFVKATLTAVAATAAVGLTISAHAAPSGPTDDGSTAVTIQTAGLDLNSQAGAKVLLTRIHFAAEAICGSQPESHQLADVEAFNACVTAAMDRTVASLGNPLVAALAHGGSPATTATLAQR